MSLSKETRSHHERYSFIPKVSIEHAENKINKINQCLTEKSDHAMPSEEASG